VYTGVLSRHRQHQEPASTLVAASEKEFQEVKQLLAEADLEHKLLGYIAVGDNNSKALGQWPNIAAVRRSIPFTELILVTGRLSYAEAIAALPQFPRKLRVKWHHAGTRSIVGSDSKDSSGESLSKENGFRLADPHYRRLKRLMDVLMAILGILLWPIWLLLVKKPLGLLRNSFQVLTGTKTWMGYADAQEGLPALRPAVLGNNGLSKKENQALPSESLQMLDYWYARDYSVRQDLTRLRHCWRKLGE
jgi:hypothetical protein